MKVVVIAGGQGTRIASVNSEIPKAMIPINGKPILEYEIEMALRYGYMDFIFIIGYMGEQIEAYLDAHKEEMLADRYGRGIREFERSIDRRFFCFLW